MRIKAFILILLFISTASYSETLNLFSPIDSGDYTVKELSENVLNYANTTVTTSNKNVKKNKHNFIINNWVSVLTVSLFSTYALISLVLMYKLTIPITIT